MHPSLLTETGIRTFITKLVALWDRDSERPFQMTSDYASGSGPVIWSLTNHTVELARTVVELSAADRMLVAMPLVRLIIENAMTIAWLYASPTATKALVHEGLRQRRRAIEHVVSLGAAGFDGDSIKKAADEQEEFVGFRSSQGSSLEQRFKALEGGDSMYSTYRMASALSHAGLTLADQYLIEIPKTREYPLGISFAPDRTLDVGDAWLGTSATMLLLAMTTCDRVDESRHQKNQLAEAASKLDLDMTATLIGEE